MKPNSKSILFVASKPGFWGGIEKYIYTTALILKKHGYRVLAAFEDKVEVSEEYTNVFDEFFFTEERGILEKLDVDLVFIHKISSYEVIRYFNSKFKTAVFIHDHDYYCMRRHKYFPLIDKNCNRKMNTLICSLCTGLLSKKNGKITLFNVERFLKVYNEIKKCDSFIVISDYMRQNLIKNGIPKDKIHKIYPVQEPAICERTALASTENNIVFLGQLIKGKGVEFLLKSLDYIDSSASVHIIGKGNNEPKLREVAEKINNPKIKVYFEGWVNPPDKFIKSAKVVVVPSMWQEPFGLVGIEAFAHKVPVVGFNVGGITEWLKDNKNGYAVEPYDTRKMGKLIEKLLNDDSLNVKMGNAGYSMIEADYTESMFIEKFKKIL